MVLWQKYRPRRFEDVVGQDKALATIALKRREGLTGRAFWISGAPGTGKTTIARILAHEVADDLNIEEFDGSELTLPVLDRIKAEYRLAALGQKRGRAYVINEAHRLRKDVLTRLDTMCDPCPPHVLWVFTTMTDAQAQLFADKEQAGAFLARCCVLALARRDIGPAFAARIQEIAKKEGLDGKPLKAYLDLVRDCRNNFRAGLEAVSNGKML